MYLVRIIAACLALLPVASAAAEETDGQVWANALVQARISDDLLFWFDGSLRFFDGAGRLGQTLARVAVGTPVNRNLSVFAGYVFVETEPFEGVRTTEHRAWQQATYPIITGRRASVVGRTRLEQRFLEGRDGMGLRLRQQFRFNLPLGGPDLPTFVAWHEAFLTVKEADWGPETGFDQHRSFVGFGFPLAKGLSTEIGYFEQRLPQPEPDIRNRALNVTMVARF
jgi:hypothetical protein